MKNIEAINLLVDKLRRLPGVTEKQANNICNALIESNNDEVDSLIFSIKNLKKVVKLCKQCNNISQNDLCEICSNPLRNTKQLCIVNSCDDIEKIEQTNSYLGLYLVVPSVNIKKNKLINEHSILQLKELMNKFQFIDILIATNLTPNGEATAFYLKKIINDIFPNVSLYRIAIGLPLNSDLSYSDVETLSMAIKNKTKY
jgi:recombination protein RecR